MSRDELLTKLAMELEEWPNQKDYMQWDGDDFYATDYVDNSPFSKMEWITRRAELINEPDDSEAPEWAKWKCQDSIGGWEWHSEKPIEIGGGWDIHPCQRWNNSTRGKVPAGHDWKTTLKEVNQEMNKNNPQYNPEDVAFKRELNPSTSSITNSQARESALETGMCSDGSPCGSPPSELINSYCADCPNAPHAQDAARLDAQLDIDIKAFQEAYKMAEARDAAEFGLPNANSILNAAAQHMQDRAATYDKPQGERSMESTVLAFSAITGHHLSEEQGWLFMQLLKAVRSQQGAYRADSYEDGAAYAALAGEAAAKERL